MLVCVVGISLSDSVCLPSISIDIELPGLGQLVQEFVVKKYKFADSKLLTDGNNITDIDPFH